jgi:predicted dehydrogenase
LFVGRGKRIGSMSEQADDYGLSAVPTTVEVAAPELAYRPRDPQQYAPAIGLVGCGGIAAQHLAAYRAAGYNVAALCGRNIEKVRARQEQYFPEARIYTDYRELLRQDDLEVVDLLPHPNDRVPIIEAAIAAGKHVLSQKPFVTDLDVGERLVELADRHNVQLAVNQNGRWAPHFAYLCQAVREGVIGDLTSAALTVHWDHSWIADVPTLNAMEDLVLHDFAVHWFDIVANFFGEQRPQRVFASAARAAGQRAQPPMLAHALIDYDGAQATLVFNATVVYGQEDRTFLAGTKGSILSTGPSLSEQSVTLHTAEGWSVPQLEGTWFQEGFHGTMAELLCAVEEGRAPTNSARDNLRSLELAFAAIASAREGVAKEPGKVRRI